MARLLFLIPGTFRADSAANIEKYICLSGRHSGDIITTVSRKIHLQHRQIGKFHVQSSMRSRFPSVIRNLLEIVLFIRKGVALSLQGGPYDIIISKNPMLTGLLAILLGRLTGSKVLIEVNGNFQSAFKYDTAEEDGGALSRLKSKLSTWMIPASLSMAQGIRLLYESQIDAFHFDRSRCVVERIPEFVPIHLFTPGLGDRRYILFLGYPWWLKGVDILILAFREICDNYPDLRLKIVGWCPEGRDVFEKLVIGEPRIELCDPVEYNKVIDMVNYCTMVVLPSRSEAMGRVLIEAMASRKPVIASNVDGIPTYIEDGVNGLLFPSGSVTELAQRMRLILSDREYADRLALRGEQYVRMHFSAEAYEEDYSRLIEKVMSIG